MAKFLAAISASILSRLLILTRSSYASIWCMTVNSSDLSLSFILRNFLVSGSGLFDLKRPPFKAED